ncbi:MAG: hypothetical protein AAGH64_00540 [Planctomycetota bacterium]
MNADQQDTPRHADGDPSPRLFSHRAVSPRARVVGCALCSLWAGFLLFCIVRTPQLGLENVVHEEHPILETGEVVLWLTAVLCCAVGSLRQRVMRSMLLLQWMGVVAMLLGMRELDLQVVLNTDNIHLLGIAPEHAMHWKTRWLLDPEVPAVVKLAWTGVIGGVLAAVLVPFGLARYPWPTRLLIKRELFPWTLAAGVGTLAIGVLIDGMMEGRMLRRGLNHTLIEESVEMVGTLLVVVWTAWLAFGRPRMHIGEP